MAATIATPIEQEVNGVDNMLYMTSLSTNDGNMLLTVTFKVGTNLDIANVLVQNRLSVAQPRLPPDVRNLGVTVRKASPDLMLVVHLLSPNKTYDQNYLANYIYLNIRDEMLRLDGVGDITIFGGNEYAERIWVDPEQARRLRTLGHRRDDGAAGAERPGRGRRSSTRPPAARRRGVPARGPVARPLPDAGGIRRRHRQGAATAASCG